MINDVHKNTKIVNGTAVGGNQIPMVRHTLQGEKQLIAAGASEPEANERGSSLISRRLHYRGLQSLFLTKRKELWLCASWRFRMRSGMRKEF